MAHEIMENDQMLSVREVPWHGLGTILSDYPSIPEAIEASGLSFDVQAKDMTVNIELGEGDNTILTPIIVPNQKALVRMDTLHVLGVVGNRYKIYQNASMWQFIETFQAESGILIETAGSLKNGKTTWVLGKNVSEKLEVVDNDPIEEFFLFRNSFDGSTPISVLFTNIRVVCNNTLSAALNNAKNIFNVRHTLSSEGQLKEVQKALGVRYKYQEQFKNALGVMAKTPITDSTLDMFLDNLFPLKNIQDVSEGQIVLSKEEISKRALTVKSNKIEAIKDFMATGAGVDIPGVSGTLYGVYNAITEWVDHDKSLRTKNRDESEAKFENAFYGNGSNLKIDAFNSLLALAA